MPDQWDGKTIKVSGFMSSTTDDTIELFFDSKCRSGGDTVHSVRRDKETNIVYVTFENAGGQYSIMGNIYDIQRNDIAYNETTPKGNS